MDENLKISFAPGVQNLLEQHEKAVELCDPKAMLRMGRFYAGLPGERAAEKAFTMFASASMAGITDAMYALAQCCEMGKGYRQSVGGAIFWYRKVIVQALLDALRPVKDLGDDRYQQLQIYCADPMFAQYLRLTAEEEPNPDHGVSLESICNMAELGDPWAQDCLGVKCWYGVDEVDRDLEQAMYWLRKAAQQEYEPAMFHLALFLYFLKEYTEAAAWYRRCALKRIQWRNAFLAEHDIPS